MESRITTPVVSEFEIIKQKLTAHIEMLRQNLAYLLKIQKGTVLDDDIFDYLKDVLGFKVPDNGKFKTDYLPILLQSLKTKMAIFLKFSEIAKQENQDVAISTLYLSLESELIMAKYEGRVAKSDFSVESKMQSIFDSAHFIQSLLKSLLPSLPETHSRLAEVICAKDASEKEYRKKEKNTHFTYKAGHRYEWPKATAHAQDLWRKMGGKMECYNPKKTPNTHEATDWIAEQKSKKLVTQGNIQINQEESNFLFDSLTASLELTPIIHSRIQENKQFKANSDTAHFDLLLENVIFFYAINPKIKNLEKAYSFLREEQKTVEKMIKNFDIARKNILDKARLSTQIADSLIQAIKKVHLKKKWQAHKETFGRLLQEIDAVKISISTQLTVWPEKLTIEWTDALIEQRLNEFKINIREIKSRLTSIETEFLKVEEQEEKVRIEDLPSQSSPYIPPSIGSSARELYLQERAKIDREYKQEVEQRRQEKAQAEKMQEVEKKDKKPATEVVVYKNLDVEQRLLAMNDHWFQLLLDLFEFKKGIKYSNVCSLIQNQLDGEIEEIGGGSSHKRIRIAKYFVEVISHADQQEETLSASSVAVGGFFRQHGGAHQAGDMSRFNMELVVNTLKKAGITLELLNQLKEERITQRSSLES